MLCLIGQWTPSNTRNIIIENTEGVDVTSKGALISKDGIIFINFLHIQLSKYNTKKLRTRDTEDRRGDNEEVLKEHLSVARV